MQHFSFIDFSTLAQLQPPLNTEKVKESETNTRLSNALLQFGWQEADGYYLFFS